MIPTCFISIYIVWIWSYTNKRNLQENKWASEIIVLARGQANILNLWLRWRLLADGQIQSHFQNLIVASVWIFTSLQQIIQMKWCCDAVMWQWRNNFWKLARKCGMWFGVLILQEPVNYSFGLVIWPWPYKSEVHRNFYLYL